MPGFNRQSSRDLAARIALARSLRAAADAQPELTIAQVAAQHGVSRASAYRLMAELARDPLCE